jgi:hypothetical protein
MTRAERKSRDFGINYGSRGPLLRGEPVTEEQALAHLEKYNRAYGQGWAKNNPIVEHDRRRGLAWARLILAAKLLLVVAAIQVVIKLAGIILIALHP